MALGAEAVSQARPMNVAKYLDVVAVLIAATAVRLMPSPSALFAGSALAGAGIGICNFVLPSLMPSMPRFSSLNRRGPAPSRSTT